MNRICSTMLLAALVTTELAAGPPLEPLDLDPTFAGDGTLIVEERPNDLAYTGLMEPSGEIVVFGHSGNGNPSFDEGVLQRIGADGSIGTRSRFGASSFGCSVPRAFLTGIRLNNGDYLAGGYVQEGCSGIPRKFNALQLTPSGGLVEEFDRVPFNNERAYIYALGEQSDGSIVAAGFADEDFSNFSTFDIAVARFTGAGVLDTSFGTNGTFTFDRGNEPDWARDIVIDANDRILITGYATSAAGDRDILIMRLDSDGALDPTFNGTGFRYYDHAGFSDSGSAIDLAPGGRILIGGVLGTSEEQRQAVILALNDNGSLDTGFGVQGLATVDLGNTQSAITDIDYDAGRIYVTGWSRPFAGERVEIDAAVAVLRSNGAPNPLFNGGQARVFVFDAALGPQADFIQSVDVSDDGEQIVVTGYTDNEPRTVQRFGIARFIGLENALFADGFEGSASVISAGLPDDLQGR